MKKRLSERGKREEVETKEGREKERGRREEVKEKRLRKDFKRIKKKEEVIKEAQKGKICR